MTSLTATAGIYNPQLGETIKEEGKLSKFFGGIRSKFKSVFSPTEKRRKASLKALSPVASPRASHETRDLEREKNVGEIIHFFRAKRAEGYNLDAPKERIRSQELNQYSAGDAYTQRTHHPDTVNYAREGSLRHILGFAFNYRAKKAAAEKQRKDELRKKWAEAREDSISMNDPLPSIHSKAIELPESLFDDIDIEVQPPQGPMYGGSVSGFDHFEEPTRTDTPQPQL